MALLEFAHILETKAIPPFLWKGCDYVLQFNFETAYIAVSVKTAADLLSRLELEIEERIRLKNIEDIQTTHIVVTTSASNVAIERHFFSVKQKKRMSQKNRLFKKKQSRRNTGMASKWVTVLIEDLCQWTEDGWRNHNVVLREQN